MTKFQIIWTSQFRLVMHEWKRRGQRRYEPRFLITQRGFNAIIDMAIRERVIALPVPKTNCLPYLEGPPAPEPLAPEVGGRIYVDDYNGNEVAVEMATGVTGATPVLTEQEGLS